MGAAERRLRLESFGSFPDRLLNVLKNIADEKFELRISENEWSIHEILVHLADIEANGYIRFRKAIAEPTKAVSPFNPNLWCEELSYFSQSKDEAIHLFCMMRKSNYDLLKQIPDDSWLHTVHHPEHGMISTEDLLQIQDEHVNHQLQRIINIANL